MLRRTRGVNAIVAVSADDHASESDRNNCAVDHAHGMQPVRLRRKLCGYTHAHSLCRCGTVAAAANTPVYREDLNAMCDANETKTATSKTRNCLRYEHTYCNRLNWCLSGGRLYARIRSAGGGGDSRIQKIGGRPRAGQETAET